MNIIEDLQSLIERVDNIKEVLNLALEIAKTKQHCLMGLGTLNVLDTLTETVIYQNKKFAEKIEEYNNVVKGVEK